MGVNTDTPDRIRLEGHVTVEEAEALMQAVRAHPGIPVDLSACEHLHAAALQVLLALRPAVCAPPADAWLRATLAALPMEEAT